MSFHHRNEMICPLLTSFPFLLCREFTGGGNYSGDEDLAGKTVIVTGANTGIGKETALSLAKHRARVILACRDMDKCREVSRRLVLHFSYLEMYSNVPSPF